MDKRHLLLADQYDKLGLYKVADNLDFIKLSQNTSDPARGGLDDPYYPVQKPKPVAVPKKDTKKNTKNDLINDALKAATPVLNTIGVISEASFPIFTITTLNSLSKEALNLHAIQVLSEISKIQKISPKQLSYLKTLINNKKIEPEIFQVLNKAVSGSLPLVSEVESLKAKMPNLVNAAQGVLAKLKLLAKNNPAQAKTTEKVVSELSKKISIIARIGKFVPIALIFLQFYLYKDDYKNYFNRIAAGNLEEIWNDALDRAKLIILLSDLVASFTAFFPPLAPLTSALMAISFGTSAGISGINKYREFTGELEKENLERDFLKTPKPLPSEGSQLKYADDFFKNLRKIIFEYAENIKSIESRYLIKMVVYPEIRRLLIENKAKNNKDFVIKISDIMSLPGLTTGNTVSRKTKNNQFVQKKITVPDFISNPQDPKNRASFYEFTEAIKWIQKWSNLAYQDLYRLKYTT